VCFLTYLFNEILRRQGLTQRDGMWEQTRSNDMCQNIGMANLAQNGNLARYLPNEFGESSPLPKHVDELVIGLILRRRD
jgi:hypothetical protein